MNFDASAEGEDEGEAVEQAKEIVSTAANLGIFIIELLYSMFEFHRFIQAIMAGILPRAEQQQECFCSVVREKLNLCMA